MGEHRDGDFDDGATDQGGKRCCCHCLDEGAIFLMGFFVFLNLGIGRDKYIGLELITGYEN